LFSLLVEGRSNSGDRHLRGEKHAATEPVPSPSPSPDRTSCPHENQLECVSVAANLRRTPPASAARIASTPAADR